MLRWAILGTSFISEKLAQAIQEVEGCELIAVGSRDLEKAKQFAKKYHVEKFYSNYDEVLTNNDVDAVYIGLPNHLHKEWTIKSAKAGKHVLCEKPFTVNAAEAVEALNVVRESNVFFMEAQMYRCHPQTAKLVELIKNNVIGKLMSFNAVFSDKISQFENFVAGGSIVNLGCYPISLVRLLVGVALNTGVAEPLEIVGQSCLHATKNYDQQSSAILKFDGDIIANILVSDEFGLEAVFRIYGEEGYIDVENPWLAKKENQIVIKKYNNTEKQIITVKSDLSLYAMEIDVVNKCVKEKKTQAPLPSMTFEDSLMNMRVLDKWRDKVGLKYPIEN